MTTLYQLRYYPLHDGETEAQTGEFLHPQYSQSIRSRAGGLSLGWIILHCGGCGQNAQQHPRPLDASRHTCTHSEVVTTKRLCLHCQMSLELRTTNINEFPPSDSRPKSLSETLQKPPHPGKGPCSPKPQLAFPPQLSSSVERFSGAPPTHLLGPRGASIRENTHATNI